MSWFRRRDETQNERLLREAGLDADGTKRGRTRPEPQPPAGFRESLVGITGIAQHRVWEIFAAATDPDLTGDAYAFVTVPDGALIVDDACTEDLSRLADAVEAQLPPPYEATATRQEDGVWVVQARRIDVAQFNAEGYELVLSSFEGGRTFTVDGEAADPSRAPVELARLGAARGSDYVVRALRLDGDVWAIDADAL